MIIRLSRPIVFALGEEKCRALDFELASFRVKESWQRAATYQELNLDKFSKQQIEDLRDWLKELSTLGTRGPAILVRDIETYLRALSGSAGGQRPRTLRHFADLLVMHMRKVPGHRIYKRLDHEGRAFAAYYVDTIIYRPEERSRDGYSPARCTMDLLYEEFGERRSYKEEWNSEDVVGKTCEEVLILNNWFVETPELRAAYLAEKERFLGVFPQVGAQFTAVGVGRTHGVDDVVHEHENRYSWSSFNSGLYEMEREGEPSKVIVDVFFESNKDRRNSNRASISRSFWMQKRPKAVLIEEEQEEDLVESGEIDDEGSATLGAVEVPIHPHVAVFDLARQLRMKVHINYLTEYQWDTKLAEKLVLPIETKDFVRTLTDSTVHGAFEDIIRGKGKGAVILLGGPPGVGKTLTAEVVSESLKRPLYSVQASQLGIEATGLESVLVKILARASRWGAVVLIDEADVYIRKRDTDLNQNAIVGVMLRLLEYQSCIVFLTTNLPDKVDDAVASRCIARIDYQPPSVEEQREIWRILAELNGVTISASSIQEIVRRRGDLSGRDIKQLLKLGKVVAGARGQDVTPDVVDFVARFRPNAAVAVLAQQDGQPAMNGRHP